VPATALLFLFTCAKAQSNYSLSDCLAYINGTTNIHNWKETVEKVTGKGDVKRTTAIAFTLQSFSIVMQVNSIRSQEGSIMDNKTYKALKGDKFPEICFKLTEPVEAIPSGANRHGVTAKGTLSVAGVTRAIAMPIKITEDENKKIIVEGVQQVKMSDYNIDRPRALFGLVKTGDVITISFKSTFSLNNQQITNTNLK